MAAQQQQQQRGGAGPPAGLGGAGLHGGLGPGAGAGGGGDLEALRGAQSIDDLRQMVQENPALLQPIIQQFAQQDPQLAQAIAANPELLFQMLSEGMDEDDDGVGGLQPGANAITLTAEENAAIERLIQLGFSRQAAAEAYLACDKNEELAANFLFEGSFD